MKVYWGRRIHPEQGTASDVEVMVNGKCLRHHIYHSPTGFCWGYRGSGSADLARSILWDLIGMEPYPELYQTFKFRFVAEWGDEWTITEKQIRDWMLENVEMNPKAWYERDDVKKKSLIRRFWEYLEGKFWGCLKSIYGRRKK